MAARAGLTKVAVVQAAAQMANAAGLEEVSLTALADHFHVRTPTLYHYVDGVAGMRRELALLGLHEQRDAFGRAVMGKSGADAIVALAHTFRAYIKAHPGVYAATVRSAADADDAELQAAQAEVVEIAARALSAYALPPDDTIHAVRAFRCVVHGVATLELAGGFGLPQDVDETFARLIAAYLRSIRQQSGEG
jgi:AcrR family transcriptional regulator